VVEWTKERALKIVEGYKPKNIYNADETGLCCRLPLNKMVTWKVDGGNNSEERIAVLLACNADETIRLHH